MYDQSKLSELIRSTRRDVMNESVNLERISA
jgi:hypothetical protein